MTLKHLAPTKKIHSFHPPQRTLLGPGPSEINPRVMAAMSLPAIGYLDPVFVEMMEELKSLLRYAYQTKNALTFPVSGPGSVGMEYCQAPIAELRLYRASTMLSRPMAPARNSSPAFS